MPASHKSGFVSIIGRPNSGKSTLLNRIVGEKVAIVTPKPQTTRTVLRGILTHPEGQIVFLDTPGIHKPIHRMNERMMRSTEQSLEHVDVLALIVDASVRFGHGDAFALELLSKSRSKKFLLLNKIDIIRKEDLLPRIERYARRSEFAEVILLSALTGENVGLLVDRLFACLSEGPPYYPHDQYCDQPERLLAAEVVREKLILMTREELPYATAVAIDRFEEKDGGRAARIYASIYAERESQKGIIIGKGGAMLKQIGTAARRDLESLLDRKVHLDLHVKVRRRWRDDEQLLDRLGFGRA